MKLALIAAVAENRVIGRDGDLPWRLPDDLRHFKRTTLGHCLIMGRKTWDSLPAALPGRTTIVLSHNASFEADGALAVSDLDAALAAAAERGDEEPIVAGGAALYELALPRAARMWLTRVHAKIEGDVFFPDWERGWERDEAGEAGARAGSGESWQRVSADLHPADERHAYAFTIEEWQRRGHPKRNG